MTPPTTPRGSLTVLSTPSEGASTADHPAPDGPGLFEIANSDHGQGTRHVTTVRRLAGAGRAPGTVLISAAAWLLVLIGGGALYVDFDAQQQYVFTVRQHQAASIIEALLLDLLMIVFTLLALGLSRAGKSSRTERALILASARSRRPTRSVSTPTPPAPAPIAAYILAPLTLAVVVDRVVAVIHRHVWRHRDPPHGPPLGRAAACRRAARRSHAGPVRAAVHPRPAGNRQPALRRASCRPPRCPPVQGPYRTTRTYGPGTVRMTRTPIRRRRAWFAVIARLADEIRDAIEAGGHGNRTTRR